MKLEKVVKRARMLARPHRVENGKKFRLGDLWRERPIVVAWVRHFG